MMKRPEKEERNPPCEEGEAERGRWGATSSRRGRGGCWGDGWRGREESSCQGERLKEET